MIEQDRYNTPVGIVSMILHKGGTYDIKLNDIVGGEILAKREIKNLIVNEASRFMAIRMAPGQKNGNLDNNNNYIAGTTLGEFEQAGLKYLAVGTGPCKDNTQPYDEVHNQLDGSWDLQNPPVEDIVTAQLKGELYRKQFTDWKFLDSVGNLSITPTNVLLLSTTFLENEAVGPLVEMGLYGGDAAKDNRNTGHMFNYKTFKVWNKPSDARLTIVWKLTF